MEELSITHASGQYVHQSYGRATEAFETAGWRPSAARQVDHSPVHQVYRAAAPVPAVRDAVSSPAAWLHIVVGGVAAALMGALLGGALHV